MGRGRVRFAICSSCAFLLRHPPFGLQCRVRPLHVRIGFISTRFRTHACASQCADVFRLPSKVLPCGMPVQLMVRTLQMAAAKMKAWTGVSGGVHGHCPCEVTLALIDTCLFWTHQGTCASSEPVKDPRLPPSPYLAPLRRAFSSLVHAQHSMPSGNL